MGKVAQLFATLTRRCARLFKTQKTESKAPPPAPSKRSGDPFYNETERKREIEGRKSWLGDRARGWLRRRR